MVHFSFARRVDLEKVVMIETPQLGNATYLFTKPQSVDAFSMLTLYRHQSLKRWSSPMMGRTSERNSGSLGRITHASDPYYCAQELRARVGRHLTSQQKSVPRSGKAAELQRSRLPILESEPPRLSRGIQWHCIEHQPKGARSLPDIGHLRCSSVSSLLLDREQPKVGLNRA